MNSTTGKAQTLRLRDDIHLARKVWHIATGLLALAIFYTAKSMSIQDWVETTFAIGVAGIIVEILRLRFEPINALILRFFSPFLRKHEVKQMTGMPYYALGASLSLFLYSEEIAVLSIIFLVFADPISSYFGIRYGKDKILPNKSLQGSFAGFVTCFFITWFYGAAYSEFSFNLFAFSLLAGLIGSFSELLSVFIDDNLTIPVVSGMGLTLLNYFFYIF